MEEPPHWIEPAKEFSRQRLVDNGDPGSCLRVRVTEITTGQNGGTQRLEIAGRNKIKISEGIVPGGRVWRVGGDELVPFPVGDGRSNGSARGGDAGKFAEARFDLLIED